MTKPWLSFTLHMPLNHLSIFWSLHQCYSKLWGTASAHYAARQFMWPNKGPPKRKTKDYYFIKTFESLALPPMLSQLCQQLCKPSNCNCNTPRSHRFLLLFSKRFLESPWIACVTQMSHIPMKMSREENRDWLSTQVITKFLGEDLSKHFKPRQFDFRAFEPPVSKLQSQGQVWPTTYFYKYFSWNTTMFIHFYIIYECFHATIAELRSCDRIKIFAACHFIEKICWPLVPHDTAFQVNLRCLELQNEFDTKKATGMHLISLYR